MFYEQLSFWRNPQSAVFTFIFPVVFVVIMGALFGGSGKSSYFGGLSALQYYVPTIGVLSVLGSCYGQLAVALAARRQAGYTQADPGHAAARVGLLRRAARPLRAGERGRHRAHRHHGPAVRGAAPDALARDHADPGARGRRASAPWAWRSRR